MGKIESGVPDPSKMSAIEEAKREFYDIAKELTSDARFQDKEGVEDSYKEGYVLEDGRNVWISLFPPRTRETGYKGYYENRWKKQRRGS